MQNKRDYHIYFLRVSSGAIYYERGIERIFCNKIMTKHKKIEIVYLTRWFINQTIQGGFRNFMLCA